MPVYHVAFSAKAGVNTANTAIACLWGVSRKARIYEVGVFVQTAPTTAPAFALVRASARGTQTTSLTPIQKDNSDPTATCLLDTAWSVNPTFTATPPHIRAFGAPASAGSGVIWNLQEMEVLSGTGLCLFNLNVTGTTLGAFSGHVVYEE